MQLKEWMAKPHGKCGHSAADVGDERVFPGDGAQPKEHGIDGVADMATCHSGH